MLKSGKDVKKKVCRYLHRVPLSCLTSKERTSRSKGEIEASNLRVVGNRGKIINNPTLPWNSVIIVFCRVGCRNFSTFCHFVVSWVRDLRDDNIDILSSNVLCRQMFLPCIDSRVASRIGIVQSSRGGSYITRKYSFCA